MVRTAEEILGAVSERFSEDTSDETISFIEDITDTVNHLYDQSNEDWKAKYEENDEMWRRKYKERFFTGSGKGDDFSDIGITDTGTDEPELKTRFEELFTEG